LFLSSKDSYYPTNFQIFQFRDLTKKPGAFFNLYNFSLAKFLRHGNCFQFKINIFYFSLYVDIEKPGWFEIIRKNFDYFFSIVK